MNQLGSRLIQEGLITEQELCEALERQQQQGGRIGQNLVDLGFVKEEDLQRFFQAAPPYRQPLRKQALTWDSSRNLS